MADKKVQNSQDRRVLRTKKILREKLFELLEEKSLENISVKELAQAADINRSTFYFYYNDINDMLLQIQDEIYEVFAKEVLAPEASFVTLEDFVAYCTRFLVFCKNNETICKFVVSNDPNNSLTNRIKKDLFLQIPDSKKVFAETNPKCYLTCFAVSGIWQTILNWMYDGMKIAPEEMALFLSNVYFYGGRTVFSMG